MPENQVVTNEMVIDAYIERYNDGEHDEDVLVAAIMEQFMLGARKAIKLLKAFKKQHGLVMTKEQKDLKVAEIVEDSTVDDVIDTSVAITAISEALNISSNAARRHVKTYAEANDVAYATNRKPGLIEKHTDEVVGMINEGKTRTEIGQYLADEYEDVTDLKAGKRLYTRIASKAGLAGTGASSIDYTAAADWFLENDVTDKALIVTALQELGYSISAAKSIFKAHKFTVRYNARAATFANAEAA